MKNYIAGSLSGIIEVIITHPIDFIKTKKQDFLINNNKNVQFYEYMKKYRFFNYYNGIESRLIGIIPMRFIFWGSQANLKEILEKNKIINFKSFLIGTPTAFLQTIIDNPIEQIKTSRILKSKEKIKLFNGFAPTLYRNIIFANCISYTCFELKSKNNLEKFLNSLIGGFFGSVLSQPFDYIKTIKQRNLKYLINNIDIKNENTLIILRKIFKDNYKKLFIGGFYRTLLSSVGMSIGFISYDFIIKSINF